MVLPLLQRDELSKAKGKAGIKFWLFLLISQKKAAESQRLIGLLSDAINVRYSQQIEKQQGGSWLGQREPCGLISLVCR